MKTLTITTITIFLFLLHHTLLAQDCGTVSSDCITSSIEDIYTSEEGIEITIRVALNDDCPFNNAVSHVSVGLPDDIVVISPSENDIFQSNYSGIGYVVENMTDFPFYSIKFNVQEGLEGIKPGQFDEFTFAIPHGSEITFFPIEVKIGPNSNIMEVDISEECIALMPVELIEFKGIELAGQINLEWATVTELNHSHFEVEKSNDGRTWNMIGKIDSHHNSSEMNYYVFGDGEIETTINYYRLKMVDFDGSFEYSDVIIVEAKMENIKPSMELSIFPNPTIKDINIELSNMDNGVLILRNAVGAMMHTENINENYATINMSLYPKGIYYVSIETGQERLTQKVIKN